MGAAIRDGRLGYAALAEGLLSEISIALYQSTLTTGIVKIDRRISERIAVEMPDKRRIRSYPKILFCAYRELVISWLERRRSTRIRHAAITVCNTTTGHSRMPRNMVATPTHAKKTVAPTLNTSRPSAALPRGSVSFEGIQAIPNPKSATPAKRATGIVIPSQVSREQQSAQDIGHCHETETHNNFEPRCSRDGKFLHRLFSPWVPASSTRGRPFEFQKHWRCWRKGCQDASVKIIR